MKAPAGLRVAPPGRFALAKLSTSPFGSAPTITNDSNWPSVTVLLPGFVTTGGRFAFVPATVIVKISASFKAPSLTVMVTLAKLPVWVAAGVQLKVAAPGPLGVSVAPVGRFALLKVSASPSASLAVIAIISVCPTLSVRLPIGLGLNTGGRLTLPTVIVKVSEALNAPSLTLIVTL